MQDWRSEALQLTTGSTQHQHDDYKEFSEACLLYLDGLSYTDFGLKLPGAMYKARCLAKLHSNGHPNACWRQTQAVVTWPVLEAVVSNTNDASEFSQRHNFIISMLFSLMISPE